MKPNLCLHFRTWLVPTQLYLIFENFNWNANLNCQSVWTSKLINSASHSHKNKKIWSIASSSYADIARHFDQSISFCKRENYLILKFSYIYRLIQLLLNNPFFFFFFSFSSFYKAINWRTKIQQHTIESHILLVTLFD